MFGSMYVRKGGMGGLTGMDKVLLRRLDTGLGHGGHNSRGHTRGMYGALHAIYFFRVGQDQTRRRVLSGEGCSVSVGDDNLTG